MNRNIRPKTSAWCDLPSELLSTIVNLLDSDENLVNFRSVCKNWRSSTPPPLLVLDLRLPYQVKFDNSDSIFVTSKTNFTVVSTAVYLLRQSRNPFVEPWLVAVEQPSAGKLRLFHPLSTNPIQNLPENFPKELPNDNFSAVKLSQGINIRLDDGVTPALLQRKDNTNTYSVNKVVLWPYNPLSVIVLCNLEHLICFRLSKDWGNWLSIKGIGRNIDDIILWKRMVWAVSREGRLFGIDCRFMEVTLTGQASDMIGSGRRKRLLLDYKEDVLFLIVATDNYGFCDEFVVYRLSSQFKWAKVYALGIDVVFFVGFDACFVTKSYYFPGIDGNCIVFQKNSFPRYNSVSKYNDDELFYEEDDEYLQVGVSQYGVRRNFKLISAFPGFSAVFWPPPQWIWNTNEEQQEKRSGLMKVEDQNTNAPGTTQLQGLIVSSSLLEYINYNVYVKYGHITKGNAVSSCEAEAEAVALLSLAKAISILRLIPVNNLTDDQVQYLVSTLAELQSLRLRVDWFVPFVEKAFVLHKSKPLAAALMELDEAYVLYKNKSLDNSALMDLVKAKARVEEMKNKVCAEIEEELKFDSSRLKIVLESMVAGELMDLNRCLGEGIF